MTNEEALERLGASTAEAVKGVLAMFLGDAVEVGHVAVLEKGTHPLSSVPIPSIAASVSYVDGVTGGNVFVTTNAGASRLAAAMMGQAPEDAGAELSELELSAVAEAMNQMMAAAAAATSQVLGEEVEISVPETHFLQTAADALAIQEATPYATSVSFKLAGEPARLVQLVPNAFVVRMTRAFSDLAAIAQGDAAGSEGAFSGDSLLGIPVRVWAELGRTRMPVGRAVGLTNGQVVELDREVDDPIDLFVNGRRFATGRLILVEDSEWAVRIDSLVGVSGPSETEPEGGTD